MNIIFSLLIILLSFNSFSQKKVEYFNQNNQPCKSENAKFYALSATTDSGWLKKTYDLFSKTLVLQQLFTDSTQTIKNGYEIAYFNNGNLKRIGQFKNNKAKGIALQFFCNGLISDSIYNHSETIQSIYKYTLSGNLIYKLNKDSAIFYHSNGKIYSLQNLTNNSDTSRINFYNYQGQFVGINKYTFKPKYSSWYCDSLGNILDTSINKTLFSFLIPIVGNKPTWNDFNVLKIKFPKKYANLKSKVIQVNVATEISENGVVNNVCIEDSFNEYFDKVAMEFAYKIKWNAAKYFNISNVSNFNFPVYILDKTY